MVLVIAFSPTGKGGSRPGMLTPVARTFAARSSAFPSENSSNRMLEQWEEHQPPIRSNTCFGVAVSARSGVQLARLGREVLSRKGFDVNSPRRYRPSVQELTMRRAAVYGPHPSHDLLGGSEKSHLNMAGSECVRRSVKASLFDHFLSAWMVLWITPITDRPSAPVSRYLISIPHVGARSGKSSRTVLPSVLSAAFATASGFSSMCFEP